MARSQGQRASRKQEARVAQALGGRTTAGSGAVASPSQKGDVRVQGKLRVECKTTAQKSYALTRETWKKIQAEAGMFGETPVMQVEFQGQAGMNTKLAVLDWYTFEHLRDQEAELEQLKSDAAQDDSEVLDSP